MFKPINIVSKLKEKQSTEQNLIDEVHLLLNKTDAKVHQFNKEKSDLVIALHTLTQQHKNLVFSLREIKRFCVSYGMNVQAQSKSKEEQNQEIKLKIYAFEEQYNVAIVDFFIVVSKNIFDNTEKNASKLVFAKIDTNSYYYLGMQGKNIIAIRKILFFPKRSIYTFAIANFIPAFVIAFSFPSAWLHVSSAMELNLRLWFACHIYIAFFFFLLFIGSVGNIRFLENTWDKHLKI